MDSDSPPDPFESAPPAPPISLSELDDELAAVSLADGVGVG